MALECLSTGRSETIVDIGGGTNDIAVIALSDIVYTSLVRVAGDRMDAAIVTYLNEHRNPLIGSAQQGNQNPDRVNQQLDKPLSTQVEGQNSGCFLRAKSLQIAKSGNQGGSLRMCG